MEEALVSIEELIARLPFTMDTDETREADGALEDLSDDARMYGKASWINAATTPRAVKNLILKAAVRHMKNPDGYVQSRAGDETLIFTDRGAESGGAYFTDREVQRLRTLSSTAGFWSVNTTAYGPMRPRLPREHFYPDTYLDADEPDPECFVPDPGSPNEPFLMYSDPVEPW